MRRLFLLFALFGMLAVGCEELLPNELKPTEKPSYNSGEPPFFITNSEDSYVVDGIGGEIIVIVATDKEYSIAIPTETQSWLSLADTRAKERIDHCKFVVAANNTLYSRSADVSFVGNDGEVLLTINISQSTANCPANEIWYINGSTTEPTTPYKTDVFGVNIISNIYNTQKECWIIKFDGDVTTIGDYAFAFCRSLTSITIPDSVTTIGAFAFEDCRSLTSVTIPDSVTTIGSYAFCGCNSLTSVTIPDGVTSIGDFAFDKCICLTSITIPDSVTTIGKSVFYGCSSLTSVTIGDSVTTIGECAFCDCSSLTSVTIPDSVTTIGRSAFEGCSSLTSVTIPDSVTTIGVWAFYGCSSLTSVTIGDSVTTIGEGAFYECSSLTSVTIGDSVTTIGNFAFYDCSSLTSITIPDSVTTIGNFAFENCRSLTSVYCKATTPPAGGLDMFSSNASGRKIYVPTESVEAYKSALYWSEYADAIVGYDF